MSGFNSHIKNGTLIDGTGKQRLRADIEVTDGKIEDIGELGVEAGERVIDAKEGFVSPCFIDNYAHSDWTRPCFKTQV